MKYVIIILTHLCFVELSSAQKFDNQVLYSFKYLSDSLDKKSIKEEVMELLINNDFTFYQAYNKGKRDSIIITNQIDRNRGIPNNIQQTTRYTQYYTICYEDNTFVVKHSFNSLGYEKDYFYYVEEPKNNWQLIDVLDTIGGLKVQKAILKTDSLIWTAYFATEIPIPYGPYTFSGLPGIVVKLNDDRGLFSFDLIEINNNKTSFSNLHVDDFKKVKEISKADFLKSRKFYFENRTLLDIQNKQLFFDDESYKQKLILRDKEYFIKNNVWLENY